MTESNAKTRRRKSAGGYGERMRSRPCRDRAEYDLRRAAKQAVADWTERANAWLTEAGGKPLPVPAVRFDLNGRAAGMAVYPRARDGRALVRLNADLLVAAPAEMIEETVPHEVAHVVTRRVYGDRARAHGREWRAVMQRFGKPPTVCHALPAAPARRLRYFPYVCACPRPNYLSSIRHRRVQHGRQRYRCVRCDAELQYSGAPPVRGHPNETAGG